MDMYTRDRGVCVCVEFSLCLYLANVGPQILCANITVIMISVRSFWTKTQTTRRANNLNSLDWALFADAVFGFRELAIWLCFFPLSFTTTLSYTLLRLCFACVNKVYDQDNNSKVLSVQCFFRIFFDALIIIPKCSQKLAI